MKLDSISRSRHPNKRGGTKGTGTAAFANVAVPETTLSSSKKNIRSISSYHCRHGISKSLRPVRSRLFNVFDDEEDNLMEDPFDGSPSSMMGYSLGLQPIPDYYYLQKQNQSRRMLKTNNPMFHFHHGSTATAAAASSSSLGYAATLASPITAATTTTTSTSGFASILKFLLVFTAGGLFFSTAIAGVTACYAMGMDNVQRVVELVSIIIKAVWKTFVLGLQTTKQVLLGQDEEEEDEEEIETMVDQDDKSKKIKKKSWKWRSAWKVLREQLGETRRTASQGVQALRQEAKLYTAAVGPPGLIPLQYVIDRLMPLSISTILEESIRNALAELPRQKTIKKMALTSFTAGTKAPTLEAARVYDLPNAMAFDCTIHWQSQLEAAVVLYTVGGLARVPVSLKNMQFDGTLRVVMTPLTKTAPGYGAICMSFAKPPKINLDIRVLGGELTKLPFLKREITSAIQKSIADELLWPRRVVIPTISESTKRPILSAKQLSQLESMDPLLEAEQRLAADPMLQSMYNKDMKKDSRDMFLLQDDSNNTDTITTVVDEDPIQHHRKAERGIIFQQFKRLLSNKSNNKKNNSDDNEKETTTTLAGLPSMSSITSSSP